MDFSPELLKRRMEVAMQRGPGAGLPAGQSGKSVEIPLAPLLEVTDEEQFVREVYWTVLGRSVEPHGLMHNVRILRGGLSRRDLVNAFVGSPEALSQHVVFIPIPEPPAGSAEPNGGDVAEFLCRKLDRSFDALEQGLRRIHTRALALNQALARLNLIA